MRLQSSFVRSENANLRRTCWLSLGKWVMATRIVVCRLRLHENNAETVPTSSMWGPCRTNSTLGWNNTLDLWTQTKKEITPKYLTSLHSPPLHWNKYPDATISLSGQKMFKLLDMRMANILIHDSKPVAKEQLYGTLVQCQGLSRHEGRDELAPKYCHHNCNPD